MIQNIGLMMTRNEEDIIEEVMSENASYFEYIYVLDGSDDNTAVILRQFKQVKQIIFDKDLKVARVRDGARDFVLKLIQQNHPAQGWITLLHGDEIFHDDPNKAIETAESEGAKVVRWESMHFFPHFKEKESWSTLINIRSIQERLKWYSPGWFEDRQYMNLKGLSYHINQHSVVIPPALKKEKRADIRPRLKHYTIRTPEQFKKRAKDRLTRGWQQSYARIKGHEQPFLRVWPKREKSLIYEGYF